MTAKKSSLKIIDVSHADDTPPADTSKEVLVTNRTRLKDPTVVEKDAETTPDTKAAGEVEAAPTKQGVDIKPLSAPLLEDEKTDAADDEPPKIKTLKIESSEEKATKPTKESEPAKPKVEAPAAPKPEAKPEPQPAPKTETKPIEDKPEAKDEPAPEKPAEHEPEPKSEPKAETVLAEDSITDDKEEAEKTEDEVLKQAEDEAVKQAKHEAAIQKLVESKQYVLPINAVEKRRSKRVVIFGILLSLLLVAAWVDLALDAGLIEIDGIQPITHFFST